MSDLLDLSVEALSSAVASESSPIATSAVAALTTSLAAGLVVKAARRSRGAWELAAATAGQAEILRQRAGELAQRNADAFHEVSQRLGRVAQEAPSGESPVQRDWRLGVALSRSAELPLATAEVAADLADLAVEAAARCESSCRPEAIAAVHLAGAVAKISALLVDANLAVADGDATGMRAAELSARVDRALSSLEPTT